MKSLDTTTRFYSCFDFYDIIENPIYNRDKKIISPIPPRSMLLNTIINCRFKEKKSFSKKKRGSGDPGGRENHQFLIVIQFLKKNKKQEVPKTANHPEGTSVVSKKRGVFRVTKLEIASIFEPFLTCF